MSSQETAEEDETVLRLTFSEGIANIFDTLDSPERLDAAPLRTHRTGIRRTHQRNPQLIHPHARKRNRSSRSHTPQPAHPDRLRTKTREKRSVERVQIHSRNHQKRRQLRRESLPTSHPPQRLQRHRGQARRNQEPRRQPAYDHPAKIP